MAYVESALVLADHESEVRITVEPGYLDDRDRDCLRFVVEVKGTRGELRLPHADARVLAAGLVGQVVGAPVRLTHKRIGGR